LSSAAQQTAIEPEIASRPRRAVAGQQAKLDALLVVVFIGIAFALRWMFAFRSGLWRDEGLFLGIVRMESIGDIFSFLRHHESHPPLFYLLMRGWLRLTGGSDTAALLLPITLGAAIVPVIYVCGRRVFGREIALISAFIAAISGSLAENSGLARPYSLLPILAFLSTYYLWRLLYDAEGGARGKVRVAYVAATAALVYTHNWAWLVVIGEWVIVLISAALQRGASPVSSALRWGRSTKETGIEWLIVQAALLLLFSPWLPVLLFQAGHAGHGSANNPTVLNSLAQLATIVLPLPYNYSIFVCLPVIAVAVTAMVLTARHDRQPVAPEGASVASPWYRVIAPTPAGLYVFAGVGFAAYCLAFLLNARSLLLLPRCLAMVGPGLLLAFVAILTTAIPGRPFLRLILNMGIFIGLLFMTFVLLVLPKSNARELAAMIAQRQHPNDLIVISPEMLASSFNHYYSLDTEQIDFPGTGRETVTPFDDWIARCRDRKRLDDTYASIADAHRAGRRIWLIILNGDYFDALPDDDAKLSHEMLYSSQIGVVRTSQILHRLRVLYGQPAETLLPGGYADDDGGRSQSDESDIAFLFDPHAGAPAAGSAPAGHSAGL